MDVREFDFHLPAALIAQEPAAERGAGRLMVLRRDTGRVDHGSIVDLPELLRDGDVLVVNDTRVFPARLLGRRVPSGGAVECLLIGRLADDPDEGAKSAESEQLWEGLLHPGQRLGPGAHVVFDGPPTIHGEILARRFHGRRQIRLWTADGSPIDDAVDAIGHVPLPPYIKRPDRDDDRDRYQTIFARQRGSIAAPTAGLHISRALMTALRRPRGRRSPRSRSTSATARFKPVRVERIEDHRLEPERYDVSPVAAAHDQSRARRGPPGRRGRHDDDARAGGRGAGERRPPDRLGPERPTLFIYPGFDFRVVGGLMTNFHLPRSSLLMLVAAFAGRERVLTAYRRGGRGALSVLQLRRCDARSC